MNIIYNLFILYENGNSNKKKFSVFWVPTHIITECFITVETFDR